MSKIPVLRVRDAEGNVAEIPAIQGPQGKPGKDGKDGKDGPTLYEIGQMLYPVGSVYISVAATDPAEIFGGVWQQLKDRFLLAAGDTYVAGKEGGEATHTLTVEEMPSHGHHETVLMAGYSEWERSHTSDGYGVMFAYDNADDGVLYKQPNTTTEHVASVSAFTNTLDTGDGQAHNNMPPYLAVYMWARIG